MSRLSPGTHRASDPRIADSTSVVAVSDRLSLQVDEPVGTPVHELAGRHVAVVGINYAPEVTGIAPYTTGMAEHLAASAESVSVLTGVPHYPSWSVPDRYRRRLRTTERVSTADDGTVRIRRLRHFVPRNQTALRRALYEATFFANAATTRLPVRPDVVVAVTPSLGGGLAGVRLAARHGSRSLVVVQDLMAKAAQQSGIAGGGKVAAATAALEGHVLRRADRVAVVSDAFRAPIEAYGVDPGRIELLPNWTHISPQPLTPQEARQKLGWPADVFTVAHTGNIGLKQDLGNLVACAELLRHETAIRFVLVGDGSQRAAVQSQATGLPNVHFVDPLDAEDYATALAAADILLVNEKPGVAEMSLPSKLTSYLSAGRPVIAAVEPAGSTAAELGRTFGAAAVVPPGDPHGLARMILKLRADEQERAVMATAGRAYAVTRLGRAAATERLNAILRGLLADDPQ